MIHLICLKLPEQIAPSQYQYMMNLLPQEKQERIARFRFQADAYRSLLGEVMVRSWVCTHFDLSNRALRFRTNEYHKPRLENLPDLHFNLSHSGQWIVAAFSPYEIGLDVERMREIKPDDFVSFFTESERQAILSCTQETLIPYFFSLWTLKESYIKATGKGMHQGLDTFSIEIKREGYQLNCQSGRTNASFYMPYLDEQHQLAVCVLAEEQKLEMSVYGFEGFYEAYISTEIG